MCVCVCVCVCVYLNKEVEDGIGDRVPPLQDAQLPPLRVDLLRASGLRFTRRRATRVSVSSILGYCVTKFAPRTSLKSIA